MDDVNAVSLRERKKARTRLELLTVAHRLFRRQGYEQTTLEQIVDEAEVSIRTLLRYFDSKLHLALAGYDDSLAQFRARIEQPGRPDTLTCWRQHVEESARDLLDERTMARAARAMKFIDSEPVLAAGVREINRGYVDAIASALSLDAGVDPDTDLYARLLAVMLVEGNSAAAIRWVAGGRKENLRETCLAVVDFAIDNFPARTTKGALRLTSL